MRATARGYESGVLRRIGLFASTIVVTGCVVGACFAALIPGVVALVNAHHYTVERVTKLRQLAQKSVVYWADGSEMDELGLTDRESVNLSEVPDRLVNAVIAIEDRSFWTNDGIDLHAVLRAFVNNLVSGEIAQGGSTITQQLVKNRILSPKRDVNRKLKEIEDALRLNRRFSKSKILEEYLNTVYFGQNSYGVKSASERYFLTRDPGAPYPRGKHLDELTVGEAALLAGLIANPEGTNPFSNPARASQRRAEVLQAEVQQHSITRAEADAANAEPLPNVRPPDDLRPRSELTAEVQDRLLNDPRLGSTPKQRHDHLLKGGLKIYTTFDPGLQSAAREATTSGLPRAHAGDADWVSSLVAIDPSTGAVKAMVGTPDFGESQYNIATHPVGRQPGSTWKVITLAAALNAGYSPNDGVDGSQPCRVPSQFPAPEAFTVNAEPHEGGQMSLWDATAGSVNCAFVRLSTSVGQDKLIDMAYKLGITQRRLQKILTLTIGTIEATPLEMATVMATIANDGIHHVPYFVQRVVAPNGVTLFDEASPEPPGDVVLAPDVAACAQSVLRHVVVGPEAHTGSNANVPGQTVFGKTGTTDGRSDAWFIGATPHLATAVWYGNRWGNLPGAGFGGDSAAPIFKQFMSDALSGQLDPGLPDPGPVCNAPGARVNPDGGRGQPGTFRTPGPTRPRRDVSADVVQTQTPQPAAPTTPPTTAPAPVAPAAPVAPNQGPGRGHGNGKG